MLRKLSYIILVSYILLLNSCKLEDDDKAKISIGFSQCIDNDIWRKSMDHTMEIEASLHPEVELTIYNADRNVKKQIADIQLDTANCMVPLMPCPLVQPPAQRDPNPNRIPPANPTAKRNAMLLPKFRLQT